MQHTACSSSPLPRGFPRPAVPSSAVTGEKEGVGLRRLSSHLGPSAAIDPVNHHLCEKKPWAPARPAGSALPPLPRVASSLCSPPPRPASNSADMARCSSPCLPGKGAGKARSEWNWGSLHHQGLLGTTGPSPLALLSVLETPPPPPLEHSSPGSSAETTSRKGAVRGQPVFKWAHNWVKGREI